MIYQVWLRISAQPFLFIKTILRHRLTAQDGPFSFCIHS